MNESTKENGVVETEKTTGRDKRIGPMNQAWNYAYGVVITILVTSVIIGAVSLLPVQLNWAFTAAITIVVFYYIGYKGFRKIDVGFNGVPEIFGRRVESILLDEGWVWLLPYPFMGVGAIDVRERTIDVLQAVVISKNKVRMSIDTRLMWKIFNPYASLSIGEGVIEDGQVDLVINTLREKAKDHTDGELMALEKELGNAIKEAADENSDRWGIHTIQVMVTKIVPADEKVAEAWEKRSIEEREADAEVVERNHIITSIDAISTKDDGSERMSPEVASAVFATERGKESPIRKIIIEGDERNPLVRASGVVNDGLVNQPSGKKGGE